MGGPAASDRGTVDRTGRPLTRTRPLGRRVDPAEDPRRIGRFTVLRRLGIGGMSVVYEAHDERIGRTVALKLMLAHDAASDRERLRREAQALARLSHPNVVEVFEIGEHDDKAYVAMALVEGQSLDRWLRLRRRSPAEIVEVFTQAGEGLAAAHAQGLVHRDFKPGNVLVGSDGRVRVVDFGLVRESGAVEPSSPSEISGGSLGSASWKEALTRTGAMVGTPAYMSPEQLSGAAAGPPSDQFAFCVALFEALYGQHPFVVDGNWQQLPYNVLEGLLQRPSHKHGVPAALGKIVVRGLERRPEQRWASMDVLLPQLRRGLDRGGPRLRTAMLGAGVVVLGLAALHVNAQAPLVDQCEVSAATMHATWSPESRDDLRDTWLGTGLPGASDTWSRVDVRVQAYVDDWWGIHHAACDGSAHAVTSATCLARVADGLRMRVQMMTRPDETMLHNAVQIVGQLPSLDGCGAVLEAAPSEPVEEVPPWQHQLDRLDMLTSAGKHDEVAPLLEALSARAANEGSPWLTAEVELRMGRAHAWSGEPNAAGAAFEEAYLGAKRLGRDRLAAEAALALLRLFGEAYSRPAEAARWAGHARAETERVGDPLLTSRYLNAAGRALRSDGRLEDALALHEQALEIQRALPSPQPSEVAQSHFQIGSVLGLLGRGLEGHPHLEEALRIQELELGPRHPTVAATLTNIGVFLMFAGRDDEALATLSKALELSQEAMPDDPSAGWVALANISVIHGRQGRPAAAAASLRRYLDGYRRRQPTDDPDVTVATTLCEIALYEGRELDALAHCEQAVALPQDESTPMAHVALGSVLSRLGRFDEAITAFTRAEELAAELIRAGQGMKISHEEAVTESKVQRGRALAFSGRYPEALSELALAREALGSKLDDEDPSLLELDTELGHVLRKLGRGAEGRARLETVVRTLDERKDGGGLPLVKALTVLAWLELDAEDVASGREHAERAVALAESLPPGNHADATAKARFALAAALRLSRRDRARAVTLAKQAAEALAVRGEATRRDLEEVQAWLGHEGRAAARRPA